ncbi:MAG: Mycothiol acetyltransferase [Candidatus Heimdallarchaeota archaeon AB_125]|nr:MAG: Mycothiol acetyltransferase [Candidatus Heimdallarchaeota archaeon AB_125]
MKNIEIQTQKLDEIPDVQELANFTYELWKISRPEINASIEGIASWIKNLVYDEDPLIVKAYKEDKLVGWILLFVHDSSKLEVNPWALGGHPLILQNEPSKLEIVRGILKACINYALLNNHTRIELCYEKKENMDEYPINPSLYKEYNFPEEDEIVFMSISLENTEHSQVEFPKGIETIFLKDADDSDLFSCFYDSFSESGDRNFLSETDEERKEYFNEHFDKEDEIIDEASIVLIEGTKLIGFTLVKPTHGEGNGHLWIMGVIPEYRGHQLGSKLLNHAIVTLKEQGYKTMSLVVDSANEAALKLYEKYNFISGWKRITHAWKNE